jgi:hypothetical protein
MDTVTLRLADASDAAALERLAQLESRRHPPPGPHLVAIRDGRVDAAISLRTREVIADPFQTTAELCELLRCHARSMRVGREKLRGSVAQPRPALAT